MAKAKQKRITRRSWSKSKDYGSSLLTGQKNCQVVRLL